MNTIIKLSVASAMALGYAAAHAGVIQPSTGSGDLILFVQDTKTGNTYARDTGIQVNNILKTTSLLPSGSPSSDFTPTPATISDASLNFSLGPDSNLTTFLSAAGSDQVQWALEAVSYATGVSGPNVRGKIKLLTTTSTGSAQVVQQTASKLAGEGTGFNNDMSQLNVHFTANSLSGSSIYGIPSSTPNTEPGDTSGVWNTPDAQLNSNNWYNNGPLTAGLSIGTASELYGATGNGATQAQVYDLGSLLLSASGGLQLISASGGSTVPLPAAVWLFGSGLLGLAGVGRRRSTSV